MNLPTLAARLIHVFEGCRLTAYRDPVGILTIGYGHIAGVTLGMKITQDEAEKLFAEDCAPLLKLVQDRPILEAAALVSFGYNCGPGALKRVLSGQSNLLDFRRAGGRTLPGLVARRRLEAALIAVSRQLNLSEPSEPSLRSAK